MQLTTSGVLVVGYGTYQKNESEGGGDMTRRDGSKVEYVEVLDGDTSTDNGVRRFTLDPSINGSRPEAGAKVAVTLKDWCEADARISPRNGRAYIASKRRNVALGFKLV